MSKYYKHVHNKYGLIILTLVNTDGLTQEVFVHIGYKTSIASYNSYKQFGTIFHENMKRKITHFETNSNNIDIIIYS